MMKTANPRLLPALLVGLLMILVLGACGQKGPLYIEGEPGDPDYVAPPAEEDDGDNENDEDGDEDGDDAEPTS